jgi:hypothetical protein
MTAAEAEGSYDRQKFRIESHARCSKEDDIRWVQWGETRMRRAKGLVRRVGAHFLCARTHSPYLVLVDDAGRIQEYPHRNIIGPPYFPRVAATGKVAYLAHAASEAGSEWLTSLAVVTKEFELIDLLPRATGLSPPSWTPDGDAVLFVRTRPDRIRREVVSYDIASGDETVLFHCEGLRSVAVLERDCVAYSTPSVIHRRWLSTGRDESLFETQVGAWFAQFGTDDLYVTLDQLAPSPLGRIALVTRWTRQGRASREEVMVLQDGELTSPLPTTAARSPRWFEDCLAMATDRGIEVVLDERLIWSLPVSKLHSFEVVA